VILTNDQLDALLRRVAEHRVRWLSEPTTDYAGTPREQRKAKMLDPSGDAIELKAYRNPPATLEASWLP
jgi:extradiol dioxygenase family protein